MSSFETKRRKTDEELDESRQRLAFALLTAALLRGLLLQADLPPGAPVAGYGWLLPGLVAADMQRQGVVPTALALTAVTALTILAGGLLP